MKTPLTFFLLVTVWCTGFSQITTPQIKAGFGIDGDLKNNFFTGVATPNNDDWFSNNDAGTGVYVIDTTGASAIYNTYLTNIPSRNQTLVKRMSYAPFSVVNNMLLMDAVFVRDYHGDDSTIFANGANKNGMSPADWSSPVSQSTPDKNEILDVFMHVKRAGTTRADSLWMFGAVSIQNTTGNRYFDFEMFQTDISYNRTTQTFTGYGPDAGHTRWEFDAAGNVTKAGDIILTSEYSSSSITLVEARIWVDNSSLSVTPVAFDWGGLFDGANSGSQYGYASIVPKVPGAFYSGLQCTSSTWAGPFGIIFGDNTLGLNYKARQFMEFSVNLTKLGLDPATLLGGSTCDKPFQKVMVKTRASTSFTAELKDFVGPFKFFDKPSVELFTDVPVFCGVVGVSNLKIINPNLSSTYNWSTLDGHFIDTSVITSVFIDAPGTYIVTQKQNSDCPVASADTITILFDGTCGILLNNELSFAAILNGNIANLKWNRLLHQPVEEYILERSIDGIHFAKATSVEVSNPRPISGAFSFMDNIEYLQSTFVYYRIKLRSGDNVFKYSQVIKLDLTNAGLKTVLNINPNPVKNNAIVSVFSPSGGNLSISIVDAAGRACYKKFLKADKGITSINLDNLQKLQNGFYIVKAIVNNNTVIKKILINK